MTSDLETSEISIFEDDPYPSADDLAHGHDKGQVSTDSSKALQCTFRRLCSMSNLEKARLAYELLQHQRWLYKSFVLRPV